MAHIQRRNLVIGTLSALGFLLPTRVFGFGRRRKASCCPPAECIVTDRALGDSVDICFPVAMPVRGGGRLHCWGTRADGVTINNVTVIRVSDTMSVGTKTVIENPADGVKWSYRFEGLPVSNFSTQVALQLKVEYTGGYAGPQYSATFYCFA